MVKKNWAFARLFLPLPSQEEHFGGRLPDSVADMQNLTKFFTLAYEVTGSRGVLEMARRGKAPVYPYLYGHQVRVGNRYSLF